MHSFTFIYFCNNKVIYEKLLAENLGGVQWLLKHSEETGQKKEKLYL